MPYDAGFALPSGALSPSFNSPAEIKIQCGWEVFTSASFIYWTANEENLDLAISAISSDGVPTVPPLSVVLTQDFDYKPGFKIGLGIDTRYDDWFTGVEYTWIRQTTSTSSTAPFQSLGVGAWFINNWFIQPNGATGATPLVASLNSTWRLSIDIGDAYLSRPYYQGRCLTVTPFAGLRGIWIRQSLRMNGVQLVSTPLIDSHTASRAWGIGPRIGLQGHWLVGCGFRVETDIAFDLLYTRYTTISHSESAIQATGISVAANMNDYSCLRAINEAGLGLGWGMYFNNKKAAVDLLCSYDFSLFWNQNMMRRLVDLNTQQINASAGNLFLHGLTATLRFDY